MSSAPTLSRFGVNFQEKLAFHILDDRTFADRMIEVLKLEFIEKKFLQIFISKVFEYKKKYSTHPNYTTFETILRAGLDEENEANRKLVRDFYARIKTDLSISESAEYVKDEAIDFCRKQKVREALIRTVPLLEKYSFDEVSKVLNEALQAGAENDEGYDLVDDFESRYEDVPQEKISFGWGQIDAITKGGMTKGQLAVVIAPTGGGKSMALVHLASSAVKNKKNVVYYTLELGKKDVGLRFDSCITSIPLDDLKTNKEKVRKKLATLESKLIIKEYPTKTATTATIRSHLAGLFKRGIKIDQIVVDYGDLLRPISQGSGEKRDQLESIYEELRAIAMEFELVAITASQTNRTGLSAEVITLDSIAEAFNKCFVADFIFTVSRKPNDKVQNTARFFIAKNRNGPEGSVFAVTFDTSKVFIRVDGPWTGQVTFNSMHTSGSAGFGGQGFTSPEARNKLREVYRQIQETKTQESKT